MRLVQVIFTETRLKGAFVVDPEPRHDERGSFVRTWCKQEFEANGLNSKLVQSAAVFNRKKGTLRGMHYRILPSEEAKIVRVISGAVYDVIADLRPGSATYRQWVSLELSGENRRMLFVPEGFAHGYLTLADNTELLYQMSEFHVPEFERGFRWNDPAFAIQWPDEVQVISERDRNYSDFHERRFA